MNLKELLVLLCFVIFTQQGYGQIPKRSEKKYLDAYFEEESKNMSVLKNDTNYQLLQQIEIYNLIGYLSGCYGNYHPFPSFF